MSSTHILRSSIHNLHQAQSQRASRMPVLSLTIPHMRGRCSNPNSTNFKSSFSLIMSLRSRSRSTVQFYLYNGFSISISNITNCQNSNQTCKSMSVCLSNHNHNYNYEFGSKYHSFMPVRNNAIDDYTPFSWLSASRIKLSTFSTSRSWVWS